MKYVNKPKGDCFLSPGGRIMSSYNQRKKKEALRRLSQGKGRTRPLGKDFPDTGRRGLHQRSFTDQDIAQNRIHSTNPSGRVQRSRAHTQSMAVSPLGRSEVQKSSPGTLFGKPVSASSSSHLFGKPTTSVASSTEGLFGKAPSSSVSSGLFGKVPPVASSSGQGVAGGTVSSDGESLFSKQPQSALFGKSTEPQSTQFGRSETTASKRDSEPGGKFLFGKPVEKMEPSSTTSIVKEEASLFGKLRKEEPPSVAQQPVSSTRTLFGKPVAPLEDIPDTGDVKRVPTKGLFGKADPVGSRTGSALWAGHQGGSGSKRPLIEMEEEGEGRGEDLSDLESFGSRKRQPADEIARKSIIKRSSLFGRALEDVQGKSKKRRSDGDEGPKQRRSSLTERHHTASPEEIKEIKSIVCKDIPTDLNLRGILVDIFQEYGEVTKVSCHPDSHSAIIYFADHESAARAKRKVKHLKRGTRPVAIYWARSQSKSSRTEKVKSRLPVSSRVPAQTERSPEKRTLSPSKRPESSRHTDATPIFSASQQKQSLSSITAALKALEGKIAQSASDRLDILEERDKLKRQERAIIHGTGTMPALVGECEDMCPEKERYMREFQRRLSMYEVENVGAREQRVCHPAAVKEYSRSSADQELPLPSDLRPPDVLVMTMDYIMNNILDKGVGEDNHSWGEWYTFLWDRTRSLRKDITQQQLCDKTAVSLLEKCTRFHIFCAHRLCEEDLSAFDPKINSENLTKCLQSLKHLYDDLSDKGILCENEAEFRAYDVLLNLNQGDILRQVQNFRDEVRNSDVIRFAVQCVSSVSSQNYVKFFKLVRTGSYLNACIMHRYFTQVRNNALEIMNKAYSQNRESPYPVQEVMRLLAFQTEEQTINFLEAHGLSISGSDVYFSRSDFFQPDFVINAARSLSIIEAKNTSLIGEVVNGGPLPPNLRHRPSSSFDKNGRFSLTKIKNGDDVTDSDPHEDVKVTVTKNLPFSVPTQSSPTKTPQEYSNVEVRDVARDLFVEVINESAREVSEDVLNGMQRLEEVMEEVAENILVETTIPMMGDITERVLMEVHQEDEMEIQQKRLERERRIQELKELTNQLSTALYQETLEAVLHEEIQQTILTEIRAFQQEQHALKIEQAVTSLGEEYLDEAIHNLIQETSRDVFEEELRLRDEALAEIEEQVHLLQQSRYLKIWQKALVKRLRFKDTIETFPSGPSTVGISEQLKEFQLLPKQQGYSISSPQSILAQQKGVALSILKYHHQRYLACKSLWGAFDLAGHLGQHLLDAQGCKDHVLWKLVVSLPSSAKSQEFGLFCSWLKSKLRRGFIPEKLRKITPGDGVEIETCSLYKTRISSGQNLANICTKVVSGVLPGPGRDSHTMSTIRDALLGCHGLVLVLENQGNWINDKAYWQEQNRQLLHLLYSKPKTPKVPLLIYTVGDDINPAWQKQCHNSLGLSTLQAEGYISEILFKTYLGSLQENKLCDKVLDDLGWLASQCPCPPILDSLALSEYVDMGLTSFFSLPIRENERLRRRAKIKEENFNPVINLYNAVIQHLSKCCSGNRLKTLNWPPSEFAKTGNENDLPSPEWNDPANLTELHNIISSLLLPMMEDYNTDSWEETREQCLFYVKSLPGSPHEKVPLISRVKWLLKRCERDFEEVCHQNYQTEGCTPRPDLVPWTSLAETCVDYMVGLLKTRRDYEGDLTSDRIVYFFQTDFDSFRQPQDWLETSECTLEETVVHPKCVDDSYLISVEERRHDIEWEYEGQEQDNEADVSSRTFVQNLFDNIDHKKEAQVSAKRLDRLIAAEKEESQRFELYLKSLLEDNAIPESPLVNDKETTSESVQKEDMLLSDKMKELRSQLVSSRRANRTAELRLQTLMNL